MSSVSNTTSVTKMCAVSKAEVSVYSLVKILSVVLKHNGSLKRSGARAGSYGLSLIHTYLIGEDGTDSVYMFQESLFFLYTKPFRVH
jgi:hypothetical protein